MTTKLVLGLAALLTSSVFGADIDGKWNGSLDTPNGAVNLFFTFKADGTTLNGTTVGPDNNEVKISNGKIEGNKLAFDTTIDFGGMPFTIPYKGELAGNTVKLTLDFAGMPFEITLKKDAAGATAAAAAPAATAAKPGAASAIDGKWTGNLDTPGGALSIGFTFKADGTTLNGSVTGPDGMETKISNGKIEGNKLTFDTKVDFGGMELVIAYKGEVAGEDLKLVLDFAGMPIEIAAKKAKA
jgi:hypothetical protein